jgi:hypothetical protein
MSSNREGQEFIINPDDIKNLAVGQCVVSVKTSKVHCKVNLPLPRQYRSATEVKEATQLKSRMRGLVALESSKTEGERNGELSAENFWVGGETEELQEESHRNKWNVILNGKN